MHSDVPPPLLSLSYRPDLHLLIGRWAYQPAPHELPAAYQQVQDQALAHRCCHWLQDIRRRSANDPQTTDWLLGTYFPDLARQLGGRLFVAYLVGPALREAIVTRPGFVPARPDDDKAFVVEFFGDEGEAMRWLQACPADAPGR